jgi:hypothetical protein
MLYKFYQDRLARGLVRRGVLRTTATLPLAQARGENMTTARILIVEDEHLIALGLSRREIALDLRWWALRPPGRRLLRKPQASSRMWS